jgi:hypothetical protein
MAINNTAVQIRRIDATLRYRYRLLLFLAVAGLLIYGLLRYNDVSLIFTSEVLQKHTWLLVLDIQVAFLPAYILTFVLFKNCPYLLCWRCEYEIHSEEYWACAACGHQHKFVAVIFYPFARRCGFCKERPTALRCPACHGDIIFDEKKYNPSDPGAGRAILLSDIGASKGFRQTESTPTETDEIQTEVERIIRHASSLAEGVDKLMQRGEEMKRKNAERTDWTQDQKNDFDDLIETQFENGRRRLEKMKAKGAGHGS